MRKASMLVQLHRLLSECTPPAPETCVLFSDADVVWLTGFWRKLQAACDNWPSAFPRGEVVVSAEGAAWPPQYAEAYRRLQAGSLPGINSGIFFGRWRHVQIAVQGVIEQYGISATEISQLPRLPQQLLPYVYHMQYAASPHTAPDCVPCHA